MSHDELRVSRKKLGLNQTEMAQRLLTPFRTYYDWERGGRRIPGVCKVAVELLVKKDQWVMQAITEKIAQSFPGTETR
jgi:DNA-binding transcriptional regulator YiaG